MLSDEELLVVVHAIGAGAVVVFPARRIVIGVVLKSLGRILRGIAVVGLEGDEVLGQLVAHGRVFLAQIERVNGLLGLPDVQPEVLRWAELLRLVPTDARIHQTPARDIKSSDVLDRRGGGARAPTPSNTVAASSSQRRFLRLQLDLDRARFIPQTRGDTRTHRELSHEPRPPYRLLAHAAAPQIRVTSNPDGASIVKERSV